MTTRFLQEILNQLTENDRRATAIAGPLDDDALNWQPAPGKWSIGQCLDHIVIMECLYVRELAPAIAHADQRQTRSDDQPQERYSLLGRLLIRGVRPGSSLKVRAPGKFEPRPLVPTAILEDFRNEEGRLRELAEQSAGLDLGRVKLASPVTTLVRLNGADTFKILVLHTSRHLDQAQRVTRAAGFPGTS